MLSNGDTMNARQDGENIIVYWSRRDFRLGDNPALTQAVERSQETGIPLMPLFILEDYMCAGDPQCQFGYPSRVFLSRALPNFAHTFEQFFIVRGEAVSVFDDIARNFSIELYVNEDVHPDFYRQIKKIGNGNVRLHVCKDQLTIDRNTKTKAGGIYSVFTPFKNAVWQSFIAAPLVKREHNLVYTVLVDEYLKYLPRAIPHTAESIRAEFSKTQLLLVGKHQIDLSTIMAQASYDSWYYSEDEALNYFNAYLRAGYMTTYMSGRDFLEDDISMYDEHGVRLYGKTSRMSLALAWGFVSARTLTHLVLNHGGQRHEKNLTLGATTFITELIWREFYKYILFHNPQLLTSEFQKKYRGSISWVQDAIAIKRFRAWIQGETGYPLVDAAMHQLAETGWMHNRARMIVASVLTKNLGVDWRWGQEYFRASLIDLDEASNNGGWQWGASVGSDPKPIRIFNPVPQAKKYDASGMYQKRWLGEDRLRNPIIPIVPHVDARRAALLRYQGFSAHSSE